jgi:biopolymer transport protein ExbD
MGLTPHARLYLCDLHRELSMKFKKTEPAVAEVDMTPMIDIVFQLIAFFMVITNFEQTQADERVKLPKDQLARPAKAKRDKELVINFGYIRNTDGSRAGTGDPRIFYAGENLSLSTFQTQLNFEKQNYVDTGVNPKEVTVIIRADAEVPTGQVQELIKKCQEASFEKFSLRAEQPPEP